MTEYWVSQGNKWCDYCKIYISNNATSIRTHELGTRHKDNVSKKLAGIRKDSAIKEKEYLLALRDMGKIEKEAKKSYERDLAAIQRSSGTLTTSTSGEPVAAHGLPDTRDDGSATGIWTAQEKTLEVSEAALVGIRKEAKMDMNRVSIAAPQDRAPAKSQASFQISKDKTKQSKNPTQKLSTAPAPSVRLGKGVASSLEVGKRKRVEKKGLASTEETAALAARESARKRMQEREKSLLGLYHGY